jgi:RNA polymerase sigma factor (TIGR02999 family)
MTDELERGDMGHVFSATYEELRRLASAVKSADPSATLNPTALVDEVCMKLAPSQRVATTSQLHFKRIATRAMRRVLVEAARLRNAEKRGERTSFVTFDESLAPVACEHDLLGLDSALDELARVEPRQALIVESRFFGGFEVAEIAKTLEVSEATIRCDWRAAKTWLAHTVRQ